MTAREAVFDLLKQQKAASESVPGMSPEQRKAAWLASLQGLMQQLRRWMSDAESDGLLRIVPFEAPMHEEPLGDYEAPALKITTPSGAGVMVVPRGLLVVGADGRVDLKRGPSQAILVRGPGAAWRFAEPTSRGWRFKDLSEETFWEVLQELLS